MRTRAGVGFAVGAVGSMTRPFRRWPVAVLVALTVVGPLATVDPEETSLLLTFSGNPFAKEIGYWSGVAAVLGMLIAWAAGFLYTKWVVAAAPYRPNPPLATADGLDQPREAATAPPWGATPGPRRLAAVPLVVALVAAGAVYAFAGQPGFYGDRLFVVMKAQMDTTG